MKEKMLVRLEKERLQARTEALEAQVLPPPTAPSDLSSASSPHRRVVRKIYASQIDMNATCNNRLIRIRITE